MNKYDDILEMIEKLRQEMNNIAIQKGTSDAEVLAVSQKLDKLLNHYQMLRCKKKK